MKIAQPTPELPVPSVIEAQIYYRDTLGFEIAWHNEEGRIGAVSRGPCAIFFRETDAPFHPATFWMFSPDVDAIHDDLRERGANITEPLENKPWGMRQFTFEDLRGNRFFVHHDL